MRISPETCLVGVLLGSGSHQRLDLSTSALCSGFVAFDLLLICSNKHRHNPTQTNGNAQRTLLVEPAVTESGDIHDGQSPSDSMPIRRRTTDDTHTTLTTGERTGGGTPPPIHNKVPCAHLGIAWRLRSMIHRLLFTAPNST